MDSLNRHTDYGQKSLSETHLSTDPLQNFAIWLKEAEAEGLYEPNAFVLGTMGSNGGPNARTVLLKGIVDGDFFFASNYSSRKAQEIEAVGKVSMVFGWYAMHRQVLVQGLVRKSTPEQSHDYFQSRPYDSQVASMISEQSQPIESRQVLDERFSEALASANGEVIPTPTNWGGYLITPLRIEFWQGRTSRMHDRIEFSRAAANQEWQIQRLQP